VFLLSVLFTVGKIEPDIVGDVKVLAIIGA
jgi:hypothetical protein